MRVASGRPVVLSLVLLIGLIVAACSSSAASASPYRGSAVEPGGNGPTAAPAAGLAQNATAAPANGAETLIIKTGQLELQVSNPEASAAQAEGIVSAAGGYVAASSRSGDSDALIISVTYRIPVAKWEATLAAIHQAGGGGQLRIVREQIQTEDVTASAVDMDARLTNLRATEQSLLGIMARASSIPDTLAVEAQLTDVRGKIETLQAQRNQVGDQAAFSTLTVLFEAMPGTQTSAATNDWSVTGAIDDAAATLVRIGQALVIVGVWLVIVGLPLGLGILFLFALYRIVRRIWRRQTARAGTGPQ
jgi:hypothetical protein